MMLHSDPMGAVVFAHFKDLANATVILSPPDEWIGDVALVHVPPDWAIAGSLPPDLSLHRFFDRFYLLLSGDHPDRRRVVVETFFSHIASVYDKLIETRRNVENIQTLLQLVTGSGEYSKADGRRLILDVGCGTGLAYAIACTFGIEIVGIEASNEMREIARLRGMEVIEPGALDTWAANSVSGAIASYVFHLGVPRELLLAIWRTLRPGCGIAANFHKDCGIAEITNVFHALGADICTDASNQVPSVHGTYVTFWKPV